MVSNYKVQFRGFDVGNLGRKILYSMIKISAVPFCYGIWERKFGISVSKAHWDIVHGLKESRLIALSWKLIHNIYPTNILLYKMSISPSQNCSYCDVVDFIEHFFFQCKKVSPLWNEIQNDIKANLDISIKLNESHIILGIPSVSGLSKTDVRKINQAIAIGRLAVSKFRYGPKRNILEIYESECSLRKIWS